jgi:GNAT superfamily N-acetyltransferase
MNRTIASSSQGPLRTVSASANFLETITVDHGPLQILGRYFLDVEQAFADRRITVGFGTLEDAFAIHLSNLASWESYPPMLNPMLADIPRDAAFSFVGRDERGSPVAVMAGRIYADERNLSDCIRSQRFIYGDAWPVEDGPRFESWAPCLEHITGPFSYIGALWVAPSMRGKQLARLLPPLTRAFALAKANIGFDVGLASDSMAHAGMGAVYGYDHVEDGFRSEGLVNGHLVQGKLLWISATDIIKQISDFVSSASLAQVDGRHVQRSAHHTL